MTTLQLTHVLPFDRVVEAATGATRWSSSQPCPRRIGVAEGVERVTVTGARCCGTGCWAAAAVFTAGCTAIVWACPA